MIAVLFLAIFLQFGQLKVIEVGTGKQFTKIQRAVDYAEEFDTIRIFPGKYFETITINTKGLTIEGADANDPPILTGEDKDFLESPHTWTLVDDDPENRNIWKTAYRFPFPHITPDEFSLKNDYENFDYYSPIITLYEDETWIRGYFGGRWDSEGKILSYPYSEYDHMDHTKDTIGYYDVTRNVFIPGRFMYKETSSTEGELYVSPANEDDPNTHQYHIPVKQNILLITKPNTVIRNIVVTHTYSWPIIIEADDCIIEDSFIVNTGPWGIRSLYAKGTIIRRNVIRIKGYYERQDYISVRKNRLFASNGALIQIKGYEDAEGAEVYENIVSGTYGIAVRSKNAKIHHNIVSRSQSLLIMPQVSDNIGSSYRHNTHVYANILHHADYSSFSSYSVSGSKATYQGKLYFYRNLVYNTKYVNKDGDQSGTPNSTPQVLIYQNTFVNIKTIPSHSYIKPVRKSTVYENNLYLFRHIDYLDQYDNCANWIYASKMKDSDGWSFHPFSNGPESDYNLFSRFTPSSQIGYFARTVSGSKEYNRYYDGEFSKMTSETGMDENSMLVSSPGFINEDVFSTIDDIKDFNFDKISLLDLKDLVGNFNATFQKGYYEIKDYFGIKSDSPGIKKGKKLDYPDFVEIADQKNPDIGCQEYVSIKCNGLLNEEGACGEFGRCSKTDVCECFDGYSVENFICKKNTPEENNGKDLLGDSILAVSVIVGTIALALLITIIGIIFCVVIIVCITKKKKYDSNSDFQMTNM